MNKLLMLAALVALPACNLSDDSPSVASNNANNANNIKDDAGGDVTSGEDLGMPDVSMPACSDTIACPTPDDESYTLTCTDSVCVSACAAAYQDNDMDGTCSPDCTTNDCAERGCDDVSGEALCVCPLGTFLDGDVCGLSPIVADPEFVGTTDWTVSGAVAEPAATDHLGNLGMFTVPSDEICDEGTSISQSVYIPEIGQTKIVVEAISDCESGFCENGALPIVFLGENRYYATATENSAMKLTYCVPESAKGQTLDFRLQTQALNSNCSFGLASLKYASANIISDDDGSCGTPNAFENGDFQATNDGTHPGWEFEGGLSGAAEVLISGGNNHLKLTGTLCRAARITATAATTAPAANTGRAISIRYRTAPGSKIAMTFDRRIDTRGYSFFGRRADLPSSTNWTEANFCLPPDLLNTQVSWTAELRSTAGSGSCSITTEGDIDEVKFVEDTRCAFTAGEVTNGDFETVAFNWLFDFIADDSSTNVDADADARIVDNNTVGFLRANTKCAGPRLTSLMDVPYSGVNAIGFDYTYRAFPEATATGRVSVGSTMLDLTEYALLTPGSVCLPDNSQGLIYPFEARVRHSGGCGDGTPVATPGLLQIDNLKFINDPTCD